VGVGQERNPAPEEEVVERTGASRVGEAVVSSLAGRRRRELLELLDRLNPTIETYHGSRDIRTAGRPGIFASTSACLSLLT